MKYNPISAEFQHFPQIADFETGDSMTIGERIKKLREDRGLSQVQLSAELKIPGTDSKTFNKRLSSWEKGDRTIGYTELIYIAQYFGVTTDYLLGVTVFPTPQGAIVARQEDNTTAITSRVFSNDSQAEQYFDYLFQALSRLIVSWETVEQSGSVADSGICHIIEYCIAISECLLRENDSSSGKSNNDRLFSLLDCFRHYLGDIAFDSFQNDELRNRIKGTTKSDEINGLSASICHEVWRKG